MVKVEISCVYSGQSLNLSYVCYELDISYKSAESHPLGTLHIIQGAHYIHILYKSAESHPPGTLHITQGAHYIHILYKCAESHPPGTLNIVQGAHYFEVTAYILLSGGTLI